MYSLRRTAIIETRRIEGTEAARELANHRPGSGTIQIYDDKGLAEIDITATQLGEVAVSRDEIRKIFHIATTARVIMSGCDAPFEYVKLRGEINMWVEEQIRKDANWVKSERELDAL
jgi:hypothetical protein